MDQNEYMNQDFRIVLDAAAARYAEEQLNLVATPEGDERTLEIIADKALDLLYAGWGKHKVILSGPDIFAVLYDAAGQTLAVYKYALRAGWESRPKLFSTVFERMKMEDERTQYVMKIAAETKPYRTI